MGQIWSPRISIPEVIFRGAGALKGTKIQDGVVLEASRSKVGKFASLFSLLHSFMTWWGLWNTFHSIGRMTSLHRVKLHQNILDIASRVTRVSQSICTSASRILNVFNFARYQLDFEDHNLIIDQKISVVLNWFSLGRPPGELDIMCWQIWSFPQGWGSYDSKFLRRNEFPHITLIPNTFYVPGYQILIMYKHMLIFVNLLFCSLSTNVFFLSASYFFSNTRVSAEHKSDCKTGEKQEI